MNRPVALSSARAAQRLTDVVAGHLETFVHRYAHGFVLPRVFAGYPVGTDVRADLAFTLGHLADNDVKHVAGVEIDDAIRAVLAGVDGSGTHTFSSYRVAETLRRFGTLSENRLLDRIDAAARRNLIDACDSTSWIDLLDTGLPANYAAVLARCELGRRALGIDVDEDVLDELLTRTRRLIVANPSGYIDDSEDQRGARYDVYTADVYLFTEPFAADLGPAWTSGLRNVVDLVARVSTPDGSAMSWGRSLGSLALCHTIELAALVVDQDLLDDVPAWLLRAERALAQFESMTDGMLVDAHKHRSQNHYRGTDRWLQLTFDCLGKLAWAAARLRRRPDTTGRIPLTAAYPSRDELVRFEAEDAVGVWTFRSPATAFVIPFVGTPWADYLPSPRNPTLYEVPVDAPLPTGVPVIAAGGTRFVGGGRPVALEHSANNVSAEWDDFPRLVPTEAGSAFPGRRSTHYRVDDHVLYVHEQLWFSSPPDSISLQVTEARHRPLRIEAHATTGCRVDIIDTDGLPEYRSFWSVLPRVHQIDVQPGDHVELTWSVRPMLRVATADPTHHYHRALYDSLAPNVIDSGFGAHLLAGPAEARRSLARTDAFHLHWPEWFVDTPEQARRFVELLAETDTLLVWTQHNLRPHREVPRAEELYRTFAAAADVVVHHSRWGQGVVMDRYGFRDDAVHVVLPHGHFGSLFDSSEPDRRLIQSELGLRPDSLCVAIVGAPRRDKLVQDFMDAFAATSRTDLELLVLSLEDERVPDDPRIVALPYEFVSRDVYNRRVAAADVIALPYDPSGEMLTTGVVADVVGLGRPAIASDWPYLTESLGDAALVYRSRDELIELLESLSRPALERAGRASRDLQPTLAWEGIAARLFDTMVAAGAFKG